MYNRPSDQIPLFVPVAVAARLQPWFDSKSLDQGLVEIGARRLSPLAMMRGAVAALVDRDAVVILQFEKKLNLHQGFAITSGHCGLCRSQAGSQGCRHQAALAILSLVLPAGGDKPLPLPLAFADSHWHKLAGFFHQWLGNGAPRSTPQRQGGRVHWCLNPSEGRLNLALPQEYEAFVDFFMSRGQKSESKKGAALLFQQLRLRSMTTNERTLEQQGMSGIGLQRDSSFSFWLAQTLYLLHDGELPRATIDRAKGLQLTCGEEHDEAALVLTVPRRKVWEVVRLCPWGNDELRLLPAARECFRVAFHGEARVEVHPCLVSDCGDGASYRSGKWELFLELSEELIESEMKFVVFTQYLRMVAMMVSHFTAAGIGCVALRGEMAPKKRQVAITAFNQDPSCRVCCASLLAGGTGIDLTGAQAVIHYDRWWNAAKEEQATSRVHRFGQKRVVQVFRLITLGTLEEKIDNLITQKRDLAASLIGEDESEALKVLDRQQLLALLRHETANADGRYHG